MRGLCYHYGMELHNFTPNAISQAACFVAVCEGFLGIPANGISGFTSYVRNSTLSPRVRCEHVIGSCWRPNTHAVGHAQEAVPAMHDDRQQCVLGEGMVLTPQRRCLPPTIHREGADGEDHRLAPWRVASRTAVEVGVTHHRTVALGGRQTGGSFDHRQLS
jgi:hypothetical protein